MAPNGDVLLVAAYGGPVDLGGGPLPFDRGARMAVEGGSGASVVAGRLVRARGVGEPHARDGFLLRMRP